MLPKHNIVDTHTHICDSSFDADRSEVLDRAADVGVGAIIAVGENIADARRNIELADKHPLIRPAAGLYPTILDLDQAEQMHSFIRSERSKLVAIGEVGLDFWIVKEESQKEIQKEILIGFISLSQELDLPLNIHSRSAGRHAVALLLENGATRVPCCLRMVQPGSRCMPSTAKPRRPCRPRKQGFSFQFRPRWSAPGKSKSSSSICPWRVCWSKPTVPYWGPNQVSATSRPISQFPLKPSRN